MNFKVLCLILVLVLASISVSFAVSVDMNYTNPVGVSNDQINLTGLVEGKDYVFNSKGDISFTKEEIAPGDFKWTNFKSINNNSKNNSSDSDVVDSIVPEENITSTSNGNLSEFDFRFHNYNLEQMNWYWRNVYRVGIFKYLLNHSYFDGADFDLPDDPFPYKELADRSIAFSDDPAGEGVLEYEKLNIYLAGRRGVHVGSLFNTYGDSSNETSNMLLIGNTTPVNDTNEEALNNYSNTTFNNAPSSLKDSIKLSDSISNESNNTTPNLMDNGEKLDNPIANAQTLEKTGIPIAMLVLVVLSVFGLRRKD